MNKDQYNAQQQQRRRGRDTIQCAWLQNKFGRGVFVGKIPEATGGEAAVVSSRLRSKDDPDGGGLDLSGGFAGFIIRLCSAGGTYEAFVRTSDYEEYGIEYVCEFRTAQKVTPVPRTNRSKDKFMTVRLPFSNFKAVVRKRTKDNDFLDIPSSSSSTLPTFMGEDIQHLGFRFRSANNEDLQKTAFWEKDWKKFYLSLIYIKVYRAQPEPEFVYISDAKLPPVVHHEMVRDADQRILTSGNQRKIQLLLNQDDRNIHDRSEAETYYKYRGEQILRNSGLSFTIVRVAGFNEMSSGEFSTLDFQETNERVAPISRAELAEVCISALRDYNALNKCFYISRNTATSSRFLDEKMSDKFALLRNES